MRSIGCGLEKTKALVDSGADINHAAEDGTTAAILAIGRGSHSSTLDGIKYAQYLIAEKHADVTKPFESNDGLISQAVFYVIGIIQSTLNIIK